MNSIANKFEPDVNGLRGHLRHWFRFDHVEPAKGIVLLVGLIPDDVTLSVMSDWGFNKSRDEEFLDFGMTLLNGEEINTWPKSDDEELSDRESCKLGERDYHPIRAKVRFAHLVSRHRQLLQYWNSGRHPEFTPLSYFVEWAISKGLNPDWVPFAVELGLIPGVTSVTEEKPITTTERNTLLTIVAALCGYSDIKHHERGASQRIMAMTDDIGAHVDDETIRNALKKIPGALETRMK